MKALGQNAAQPCWNSCRVKSGLGGTDIFLIEVSSLQLHGRVPDSWLWLQSLRRMGESNMLQPEIHDEPRKCADAFQTNERACRSLLRG